LRVAIEPIEKTVERGPYGEAKLCQTCAQYRVTVAFCLHHESTALPHHHCKNWVSSFGDPPKNDARTWLRVDIEKGEIAWNKGAAPK
jgi:hypothetical protein